MVAMATSISTAEAHLHNSYGPSEPTTKRHFDMFSRFCTDDRRMSLYFTMGRPSPPSKLPPSHGGIWAQSNTWFFWPTRILNPNGISIGETVFVRAH